MSAFLIKSKTLEIYPHRVYNILMEKCCCEKTTRKSDDIKKKLNSRLNIIEGQVRGINQMIADDRYCGDILIQISAVINSLKTLSNNILKDHMHSCVIEQIQKGNTEVIDELVSLLRKFDD